MKSYKVEIRGITPYLQHRMDDASLESWEKSRGKLIERPELSQEDSKRAEFHCYRNKDGSCYIPSDHLRGAMINAGSSFKAKVGNSRKSMKNIVAAMFYIQEEEVLIPDYDDIDKRSAVNKNIKARVIIIRPKWNSWDASFTLNIDDDTITGKTIQDILRYAGSYVGIGSFRPSNNGMFGRFEVVKIFEN